MKAVKAVGCLASRLEHSACRRQPSAAHFLEADRFLKSCSNLAELQQQQATDGSHLGKQHFQIRLLGSCKRSEHMR